MNVFDSMAFPCAEFGQDPVRKVRLVASPQTTGEQRCSIVVTTVPPGGISEGHMHDECDEYIFFDIGGRVLLDGEAFDVAPKGLVHAPKGHKHECRNTSDQELTLYCFFIPSLTPYGKYPELIERTNEYLGRQKDGAE